MPEAKLWHNKTETKKAKVTKIVEFIKTYQNLSIILPPPISAGEKIGLQKTLFGRNGWFSSA